MKTCPRCNRSYPDSENFCEADSSPLISTPAFTQQSASGAMECPVCGGKAEPGEIICNFCGARLDQTQTAPPPAPPTASAPTVSQPSPYPRLSGSGAASASQPAGTARMQGPIEPEQGRSMLGIVGYVLAAIVALAAGAWFAIHLSAGKNEEAGNAPSPASVGSTAAVAVNPTVMLANAMPVQVSGAAASSSDRNTDVIRKAFDDNRGSLVDTYTGALGADPKIADGMLVRLHINADGSIANGAVRTSTSPNPDLDAKVVGTMSGWKLSPTNAGDVDVDYPVIFAHSADEEARLETDLQSKVASLSSSAIAEYTAATAPVPEVSPLAAPSSEAAAGTSPAAAASPAMASIPPEAAPASEAPVSPEVAKPHRKHKPVAPAPPSVFEQVQDRLKSNPKLRRVKAYTTGGTVTLFGKVFGEGEKSLAEETVRNIPGVTGVVDNIATDEGEWAAEQSRIQQQLANAGLGNVTVTVIGHDAILKGEVKTDLEKSRAVTLAEGAAPVTVRENLIRVTPGNMFGF